MQVIRKHKRIGNFTVEIESTSIDGWSYVRITDINGAPWFTGTLKNDDIPLEVVSQIETAKEYLREESTKHETL